VDRTRGQTRGPTRARAVDEGRRRRLATLWRVAACTATGGATARARVVSLLL